MRANYDKFELTMQVALQNIFDYHLLYYCTINPSFSINFKKQKVTIFLPQIQVLLKVKEFHGT